MDAFRISRRFSTAEKVAERHLHGRSEAITMASHSALRALTERVLTRELTSVGERVDTNLREDAPSSREGATLGSLKLCRASMVPSGIVRKPTRGSAVEALR